VFSGVRLSPSDFGFDAVDGHRDWLGELIARYVIRCDPQGVQFGDEFSGVFEVRCAYAPRGPEPGPKQSLSVVYRVPELDEEGCFTGFAIDESDVDRQVTMQTISVIRRPFYGTETLDGSSDERQVVALAKPLERFGYALLDESERAVSRRVTAVHARSISN
jgi:hypothetical protein